MLEQVHANFQEWVEGRHVKIDGVRVAKLPGKGIGVVATRTLKVNPHAFNNAQSAELPVLMLSRKQRP